MLREAADAGSGTKIPGNDLPALPETWPQPSLENDAQPVLYPRLRNYAPADPGTEGYGEV